MERMIESRDIKHMACVERIKQLEEENKKLKDKIKKRKMYCEEKNENGYSLAIENAELKKQNDNLHEKLGRMQGAFLKFQRKYEEIERELEQIIMIR